MLASLTSGSLVAPADSARAVAHVYTVSLLALAPLVAAFVTAVALRGAGAGARALAWKSAVVVILAVCLGRALPVHWVAWVVPSGLAGPLVALGQLQLAVDDAARVPTTSAVGSVAAAGIVPLLLWAYLAGVAAVLLPLLHALSRRRALARRARPVSDPTWTDLLATTRARLGIRRAVLLLASDETAVPVTWGVVRPVVLIPSSAFAWDGTHRRAVLLHELGHVKRADGAFILAARVACALLWFHPGVWLLARALAADCELACDDLVLAAGVARSDYAELLVLASHGAAARARGAVVAPAMALAAPRRGLRHRLAEIVDERRRVTVPARAFTLAAAAMTFAFAVPVATASLAPTRDVLTTLMHDTRWESRAYAVTGLAQRRDSVEVARAAARLDPSPRVRAWALHALEQPASRGTAAPPSPTTTEP